MLNMSGWLDEALRHDGMKPSGRPHQQASVDTQVVRAGEEIHVQVELLTMLTPPRCDLTHSFLPGWVSGRYWVVTGAEQDLAESRDLLCLGSSTDENSHSTRCQGSPQSSPSGSVEKRCALDQTQS